jgi:tRNA threonylcarbamoyl adenosine modification protein YjeE
VEGEVTSPTYTIVSEYEGRLRLHHVDAYRLSGPEDFDSVGGEDLLSDAGGVCLIEWSERVSEALPAEAAIAEFEVLEDGCRRLRIEGAALETMIPKEGDTLEAMTPKEGDALGGDRGRSLGRSRP